ncbi:MAG: HAD-IA family hydrolase [Lachnospiraceae bacterium]|nr:HAD-IA family hydrolase [Lachnospiraceae bacterium]
MKFDAVILDVDGTVWDSTELVAKAWTKAAKDCEIDTEITADRLKGLFGKTMHEIADALLPDATEEEKNRVMYKSIEEEDKVLAENTVDITYPEVSSTIKELSKKLPVCIVSNCQKGYIELFMEKANVKSFITDTECYGNNGKGKADNLRLLIERNGFLHPCYVGDTLMDEIACREAGVPFIFASYGFGEAKQPVYSIDSFKNLLNVLN